MQTEIAYAKINLALHVRRHRADGYHDIETLFAFCEDGDVIEAAVAERTSLRVIGPFSSQLRHPGEGRGLSGSMSNETLENQPGWTPAFAGATDNLVLKAARAIGVDSAIRLTKSLPVASGIGGGSADAAATLRLLGRLSGKSLPDLAAQRVLGADVPACVVSRTMRGEAAGDVLTPAQDVTGTPVLLVNPGVPLSTQAVFARWDGVDRGPLDDWRSGRNDLEAPARALVPAIGDVLDWLDRRRGATLVRMSGSGATCFALFDGFGERDAAARAVPDGWWSLASILR